VCALLAIGCGKQLNPEFCAAHPEDSRCIGAGVDGAVDAVSLPAVSHLGTSVEADLTSTAEVTIDAATTIDTAAGTVDPPLPGGAVLLASVVQESGPSVMVIQAASITVTAAMTVRGDKPLILVADTIDLEALLDVSGGLGTAGPGGSATGLGDGSGTDGASSGSTGDSAGGGASFGSVGGKGGGVSGGAMGGIPGVMYGGPTLLVGGSGGGAPSHPGTCTIRGGGGGGAVQLTARTSITIASGVDAGGGGGEGGRGCGSDGSGGGGGGSGGMIFLEAPMLLGSGMLAANGGGGGEGASTTGANAGVDGTRGTLTNGGTGGVSGNSGGDGGSGGAGSSGGVKGSDGVTEGNGGGGGGGTGRIYIKTSGSAPSYTSSPPATML
jgi:hypothetical protein